MLYRLYDQKRVRLVFGVLLGTTWYEHHYVEEQKAKARYRGEFLLLPFSS